VDPLEIVQSTGDAAFATDDEGRIVIWNRAAERLLGYPAARVLGKSCHEILCGKDVFGNRFCDEDCNLLRMIRREEPIRRFEIDFRTASDKTLRMAVSALCVRGPRAAQFTLIHLLQPVSEVASLELHTEVSDGPTMRAKETPGDPPPALTAREVEVLRHLAEGLSTREIADTLYISVATVRTHIQNVLQKLDVHSQAQAVALALRKRLI
jgi:PAS domain S-box-containing protein